MRKITALFFVLLFLARPSWAVENAAETVSPALPSWLEAHIGFQENQIAPVVLERARAHYQAKVAEGKVSNPCYLAMDATRPHLSRNGKMANRFYVICEARRSFQAFSSGHGSGVQYKEWNFANDKRCARYFSNAQDSQLSMGGAYLTGEVVRTFKGMRFLPGGRTEEFLRPFVQYWGEGESAPARTRDIGGHAAIRLADGCYRYQPRHPRADSEGYVFYGTLLDYANGRSNGCTSWTSSAADFLVRLVEGRPTSLYIYPESRDIQALVAAQNSGTNAGVLGGEGARPYWSAECLSEVKRPAFFSLERYGSTFAKIAEEKRRETPQERKLCP